MGRYATAGEQLPDWLASTLGETTATGGEYIPDEAEAASLRAMGQAHQNDVPNLPQQDLAQMIRPGSVTKDANGHSVGITYTGQRQYLNDGSWGPMPTNTFMHEYRFDPVNGGYKSSLNQGGIIGAIEGAGALAGPAIIGPALAGAGAGGAAASAAGAASTGGAESGVLASSAIPGMYAAVPAGIASGGGAGAAAGIGAGAAGLSGAAEGGTLASESIPGLYAAPAAISSGTASGVGAGATAAGVGAAGDVLPSSSISGLESATPAAISSNGASAAATGSSSLLGTLGKNALTNFKNDPYGTIGRVGSLASGAAQGAAAGRRADALAEAAAGRVNQDALQIDQKRAVLRSLLGGVQDAQVHMPAGSTVPNFNITGGLRPSALSNKEALMAELAKPAPTIDPAKPGAGEKILGAIGTGASIYGALGGIYKKSASGYPPWGDPGIGGTDGDLSHNPPGYPYVMSAR